MSLQFCVEAKRNGWEVDDLQDKFHSADEYLEFTSIPVTDTNSAYSLVGRYGPNALEWFGVYAFMDLEVRGPALENDNRIVVWAEFDIPDRPGTVEAFECVTRYEKDKPFVEWHDITIRSYTGVKLFERSTWYPDRNDVWNRAITWVDERYTSTYDPLANYSTQACFAMRDVNDRNSAFKIKEGVIYTVRTGYAIHDSNYSIIKSAYNYGTTTPLEEGIGSAVEIQYWGVDVQLRNIGSSASALAVAAANLLILV